MKEKLIKDLDNCDLSKGEKEYIIAVVKYIDSSMEPMNQDEISFTGAMSRMLEIAIAINNCQTGVEEIDGILEVRKQNAHEQIGHFGKMGEDFIENNDFRTNSSSPATIKYISMISNYGGLYQTVCDTYKANISKVPTKKSK